MTKTYAMICGDFCKIGRSNNPDRRREDMKTGNPLPITIIHTWEDDRESELHRRFSAYRESGEWFRIDGKLTEFLESLGYAHKKPRKKRQPKPMPVFDDTMDVYDVESCAGCPGEIIDNLTDFCEWEPLIDHSGTRHLIQDDIDSGFDGVEESVQWMRDLDDGEVGEELQGYTVDQLGMLMDEMILDLKINSIAAPIYNRQDRSWSEGSGGVHIFFSSLRSGDLKRTISHDNTDWWWLFDACFAGVLFVSTHAPTVGWEPSPVRWICDEFIKHTLKS